MRRLVDNPSKLDCKTWVRELAAFVGPAFHPDTFVGSYEKPDGSPLFENGAVLDDDLDTCAGILEDELYNFQEF